MRLLSREQQGIVYKELVEIIKVLARTHGNSTSLEVDIRDAIASAYRIASIVGGREMLNDLEGIGNDKSYKNKRPQV